MHPMKATVNQLRNSVCMHLHITFVCIIYNHLGLFFEGEKCKTALHFEREICLSSFYPRKVAYRTLFITPDGLCPLKMQHLQ